jgi:hypothetical protein
MVQTGSPCAFQEAINLTFHEFESAVCDQIHREMWETLPALLITSVVRLSAFFPMTGISGC